MSSSINAVAGAGNRREPWATLSMCCMQELEETTVSLCLLTTLLKLLLLLLLYKSITCMSSEEGSHQVYCTAESLAC